MSEYTTPPVRSARQSNQPIDGYKRAYKACENCRKTKAKCQLDGVSLICLRCRREHRTCVFPEHRSNKRQKTGQDSPSPSNSPQEPESNTFSRTATSSSHWQQDIERDVVQTVVSSSNDALQLLFKAAEQQDSADDDDSETQAQPGSEVPDSRLNEARSRQSHNSDQEHIAHDNVAVWQDYPFVREGWLSASEATGLIDFFFARLSPLSAIPDSYYAPRANHSNLVRKEPLLCTTFLMIASRYHVLRGPGALARGAVLHDKLWTYLQDQIAQITFGLHSVGTANIRTMGSIQALLLITEWHPRALHFPGNPGGSASDRSLTARPSGATATLKNASAYEWVHGVLGPAKRSDRMSWTLLGLATTLAHELGVFRDPDQQHDQSKTDGKANTRTRELLFLYASHLSLRLGCTSMLPDNCLRAASKTASSFGLRTDLDHDREIMVAKWIEVTKILKSITEILFANKSTFKQIACNGGYADWLETFRPRLDQWLESFQSLQLSTISDSAKHIVLLEYHHARMNIFSLALQAIVERRTDQATDWLGERSTLSESSQDMQYVQEVRQSCCDILSIGIMLQNKDQLRVAPVRVFLRLVSASIFLLKSMSLGLRGSDLSHALQILDRCIDALKSCHTDELHLSTRYGELLGRYVRHFERNFRSSGMFSTRNKSGSHHKQNASQSLPNSDVGLVDANNGQDSTYDNFPDDWLFQPFDPSLAPFGIDSDQHMAGFASDSLDFLWQLPA